MALRKHWTRPRRRRLASAPAFALAMAVASALLIAACSSAATGSGASGAAGAGHAAATPAVTAAQARRVFDRYAAANAKAVPARTASPLLPLVTGVERAVLTAALGSHRVVSASAPAGAQGAYQSSLSVTPGVARYSYGPPTFYRPAEAGYPRFFVASVTRTLRGTDGAAGPAAEVGDALIPLDGPVLMLFEQASATGRWRLASTSSVAAGQRPPKLATDSAGYVPVVAPTSTSLVAQPGDVGPLQAAVVDDGPASAAAQVVAAGQLSTGMYRGAAGHADGMTAPHGDVYQWELQGASFPVFALRTAAGGALVFYAMSLSTTVEVPDVINKGNPIRPGPPIQVPVAVRAMLPPGQPAPRVQLQAWQTLSFAAVDPVGAAKIQVIAAGGGLTGASAS